MGALGDFLDGGGCGRSGGVPGLLEGLDEGGAVHLDIAEEVAVRAVAAVFGLLGGFLEGLGDEVEVEVDEKGAVEENGAFFAALGVAGEFYGVDGEVGVPLDGELARNDGCEGGVDLLHDEDVGCGDGVEFVAGFDGENQGIVQAAGALEDGAAAGGASEDGNPEFAAAVLMDFVGQLFAEAQYDSILGRFPKGEEAGMVGVVFAEVEEGFFGGEKFCGCCFCDGVR